MKLIHIFVLVILFFNQSHGFSYKGVNGGVFCVACTAFVGVFRELMEIQQKNASVVIDNFCSYLADDLEKPCKRLFRIWGKALIEKLNLKETPDVICYSLGICHVDEGEQYCHLFPLPEEGMEYAIYKSRKISRVFPSYSWEEAQKTKSICDLPGIRFICLEIELLFNLTTPMIDHDKDLYSDFSTLRGYSWSGKDCNDKDANIHPGRKANNDDLSVDSNCNGIWKQDPVTGNGYENVFCNGTNPYGLIYIGDSIGAHFHIPAQWITATKLNKKIFRHFDFIFNNQLDWPETSFATGYRNITWPILNGYTDSLYLRLRNHNLCNHRDYQNLAKNGAKSKDITLLKSIARNKTTDNPAIVFYAMMGNDVCNNYMYSLDNLTTPKEFKQNVLESLKFLDSTLPINSHVILVGLVDGKFIYSTMKDHLHPLGELNKDVTYEDLFSWLNCMKLSLCYGWMNKNETIQNATSRRAAELTDVLRKIAKYYRFRSFQLHFLENPMHRVLQLWQTKHELWKLMEPVDSLHPVQAAQPYITEVLWKDLFKLGILNKPNPNNKRIIQIFGNQGGH